MEALHKAMNVYVWGPSRIDSAVECLYCPIEMFSPQPGSMAIRLHILLEGVGFCIALTIGLSTVYPENVSTMANDAQS